MLKEEVLLHASLLRAQVENSFGLEAFQTAALDSKSGKVRGRWLLSADPLAPCSAARSLDAARCAG